MIGCSGDLVGRRVSLFFLRRLRDEKKFTDVAALVAQLHEDRTHCLGLLEDAETVSEMARIRSVVDSPTIVAG